MHCENCRQAIKEEETHSHGGKKLCEDCFMEAVSVPKTCDPMSVRSARITRESQGLEGDAGLIDIQKSILQLINEMEKIPREEVARQLNLSPKELEKHFAVLRHCELAKASKEGDTIYLKPFEK